MLSSAEPRYAEHLLDAGVAILYPDYRLLDPSSCWDELQDVQSLRQWMSAGGLDKLLPEQITIDQDRIGFTGFSAGGWVARIAIVDFIKAYAAGESKLKPAAFASFFGMGGSFLTEKWFAQRNDDWHTRTPEHIAKKQRPSECADCAYTPTIQSADLATRGSWCAYWWDSGNFLDLCLDEPGFAAKLRKIPVQDREDYLTARYEALFPQIFLAKNRLASHWPATILVHGSLDPIVSIDESLRTHQQLQQLGVPVKLRQVEFGNHDLHDENTKLYLPDKAMAIADATRFLIDSLYG